MVGIYKTMLYVSFTAKIWFDMTLYHDIHMHYSTYNTHGVEDYDAIVDHHMEMYHRSLMDFISVMNLSRSTTVCV